jgi:deferrochelatase/peroxidase EfeB
VSRVNRVNRRSFLGRSIATVGAGGVGAAIGASAASGSSPTPDAAEQARAALARELAVRVPFDGPHQSGILTPRPDQMTLVALDSVAPNTELLFEALQALTGVARGLANGQPVPVAEVDDPPPDSGILGPYDSPDALTVTVAFGAALFDHRYGLARSRPRQLIEMPSFPNDDIDPARAGGDVLVQVCANHRDTVVHTVRELMRTVAGKLTVRWTIDGFQSTQRGPTPSSSTRNLFAFRDGTGNPHVGDAALMKRLIWVAPGAAPGGSREPAWTAGGTYAVVRTIRMHVEFWDRVGMLEQEQMIGRDRVSGAPLGGTDEFQHPRYDLDPNGKRIPLDAHIRLANPRTTTTADQRILRRGYNYHRGIDEAGDLDQGLVFVAFNQDPERQFATIQRRLGPEPMVDYITPVGGGYYFVPPGTSGESDWIGSGLTRA